MINAAALISVLESEKETYQALLDLSKRKHNLIVEGDIEGLQDAVRDTERTVITMCNLEKERQKIVGLSRSSLKAPQRLSTIIRSLDEASAAQAQALREEILSIMNELDMSNKTNAELIKKGIGHIQFMLSSLVHDDNPTYSNKTNPQKAALRLFDGRA
ncbi:MAG TPA: flagellar protein FlgN [Candidatus Aquicultor sp.]|jgi:CRISPR/Cas system-associated protein Cas10 (large subunit of type III CRISPR-Cas system)